MSEAIESTLALAGVCQAAALVQAIARTGQCDDTAFQASISSICVTEPEHPQQVYGQLSNLKIGYTTLVHQLNTRSAQKDAELTRYVASLLGFERKLAKRPDAMNELGQRISNVQRQLAHVEFEHHQILNSLASAYVDIISPLAPRIQVAGNPAYLGQAPIQAKVRALLLAGVRSAVLWRQMGGQRRQILLNRKRILRGAQVALQQMS